FARTPGQGPTPYPVACQPQAWASGAAFLLLQASLGLSIDGERREVHIDRPMLPVGIQSLQLREIQIGDARIDLTFYRIGDEVIATPAKHLESGVRVIAHL